jgi:carboxylate-amine ligase
MTLYRFGIEDEYFVIDLATRNVRRTMSQKFYRACKRELGDDVKSEMLQSQIEVSTPPCTSMAEARAHLRRLRAALSERAARHGLGIVAAGTHPLAAWPEQRQTPKDRYGVVMADLQMLGLRNMLCGLHVHVEVPIPELRVELMYRVIPFLPLLLSLSTSSPFWQAHRTGLLGYRLAAYDELPRTGLPEPFRTAGEFQHYVDTLVAAGVIPDASYIWWAVRPSARYPTLELRIADACTHREDALCIAAIFRCLMRRLVEDPKLNSDLDVVGRAIVEENKWRAQRYGTGASFVDRASMQAAPVKAVLQQLLVLLGGDAEALDCRSEVQQAMNILERGSSADEQIRIYESARAAGRSRLKALREVVDWLNQATIA